MNAKKSKRSEYIFFYQEADDGNCRWQHGDFLPTLYVVIPPVGLKTSIFTETQRYEGTKGTKILPTGQGRYKDY